MKNKVIVNKAMSTYTMVCLYKLLQVTNIIQQHSTSTQDGHKREFIVASMQNTGKSANTTYEEM